MIKGLTTEPSGPEGGYQRTRPSSWTHLLTRNTSARDSSMPSPFGVVPKPLGANAEPLGAEPLKPELLCETLVDRTPSCRTVPFTLNAQAMPISAQRSTQTHTTPGPISNTPKHPIGQNTWGFKPSGPGFMLIQTQRTRFMPIQNLWVQVSGQLKPHGSRSCARQLCTNSNIAPGQVVGNNGSHALACLA